MEISLSGSSQVKLGKKTDLVSRDLGFGNGLNLLRSRVCYGQSTKGKSSLSWFSVKVSSAQSVSERCSGDSSRSGGRSKPNKNVRLYVGLPLDSVSECNSINHSKAIVAGLRALKLLGVDGVELPVWWGIAEKEAMGNYQWSGYLALAEMVQKSGLKLHVSLCFHASQEAKIPLPKWVTRVGESQPGIFFTDRSGQGYKDCLSLAVDELPVLDGKTPVHVYQEFCESFKASFAPFMGSTITGISMSLGPDGELRYPFHHDTVAGDFQCYDENMLKSLKQHAAKTGNHLWGNSGPHDASKYENTHASNTFFKDNGGSWESSYGEFFLSWYSSQLAFHCDRLLSLASSTFSNNSVTVSGKIPLLHSSYKTRSHPDELTAGLYNTVNRDGYQEIVKIFEKNSSLIILPGMDLSDETAELLLAQITAVCRKHNVDVSGQNSVVSKSSNGFDQIKKNLKGGMDLFTYQRMGASFFSPDHFPSFSALVRSLSQVEFHSDDMPVNEKERSYILAGKNLHMQTA